MTARLMLTALALAMGLTACDAPRRFDAAQDVQALLQAIQAGDRQTFERHIDRPALRNQMRGQVSQLAAGAGLQGADVDAFIGGRAGDVILDQMIAPESFRIAWRRSGVPADRVPTAYELVPVLRMTGDDRACLHDLRNPDDCVLTFEDQGGTWKLVALQPGAVQMAPAAPPAGAEMAAR